MSGMLAATLFGILSIPALFVMVERPVTRKGRVPAGQSEQDAAPQAAEERHRVR